jgi:ketosteroid isomerase-like protein
MRAPTMGHRTQSARNIAQDRTAAQGLQPHASAFIAGYAALIACDYAEDAIFVLPGSVAEGRTQIQATFGYFLGVAGGNVSLSLRSLTIAGNAALLEYAVDSNHLVVSDGVDTFVVRHGLIVAQTAHLGGFSVK